MKILILGCYYSPNLGDGVICECVAKQIRDKYLDADIYIEDLWDRSGFSSRDQDNTSIPISHKQLIYRRLRGFCYRIITKYLNWDVQYISMNNRLRENQAQLDRICAYDCDLVVFAGGQMFMDGYALRLWYVIKNFEKKGVPVILNACGTGPTYSKKLRKHLRYALNASNVVAVSCRDDVQTVNEFYFPLTADAVETFDPALSCANTYGIEKNNDAKVVGLGIMQTGRLSPKVMLRFWHRLIAELENNQVPWKVFVNGENCDLSYARYVIETLPGLHKNFEDCFVQIPLEPEELLRTISQFKSIISFRLHSHIIATSLDIPSVAVVWDDKVRSFFEKIGHPERCCTIHSSPIEVLDKLAVAEMEGFDRALIQEQSALSEKWLIDAIQKLNMK